jgi:hypothetical protein
LSKLFLYRLFIIAIFVLPVTQVSFAQADTTGKFIPADSINKIATPVQDKKKVDSVIKVHSPRKAVIRSALIPGWGQAYNKKYWKIPIIYGALGTTAAVFIFNLKTYRELRLAYKGKYLASLPVPRKDSSFYRQMDPKYIPFGLEDIRYYRDEYRRNIDYSVLFFLAFWGLNVIDASVDAHLKSFDVSPDLSLRLRTGYSDLAQTNGISLVLSFK